MSSTPIPEMAAASSSGLDRIYSEETEESPFGSSLVTPDDEESTIYHGIHERLDAAKSILSYFEAKDLPQKDAKNSADLASEVVELEDEATKPSHDGLSEVVGKEDETSHSLLIALNSSSSVGSPILSSSSSELIDRSGLGVFYTLPNDHIIIEPQSEDSPPSPEISQDEVRPLIDSDSIPVIRDSDLGAKFWAKELGPTINSLTCRALVSIAIRLVCFLPWCVAVGGALLFSPEHLELLAFRTGYVEALSGIRRYSHWAEYGFQHIAAFLTFLGILTWWTPTTGLLCIGGLMAQFCWAWHTFLLDRNIPLGEDDKQTVYLLATSTWLKDTTVNIRKIGDSYYATGSGAREEGLKEGGDDSD